MSEKIIVPKIKKDTGGMPLEFKLPEASTAEILRAPEDVRSNDAIFKSYPSAANGSHKRK